MQALEAPPRDRLIFAGLRRMRPQDTHEELDASRNHDTHAELGVAISEMIDTGCIVDRVVRLGKASSREDERRNLHQHVRVKPRLEETKTKCDGLQSSKDDAERCAVRPGGNPATRDVKPVDICYDLTYMSIP